MNYNYAKAILHTIVKALRRSNGRKLKRQEKAMARRIQAEFEEQKKFILRKSKKLFEQKSVNYRQKAIDDDIDSIFDDLSDEELKKVILESAGLTMLFGANYRIKKEGLARLGITFDLSHPLAEQYLKTDRVLILSKLNETTKEHIKPILLDAVERGASYQETAKKIAENYGLSRERSLMIATHETGKAYEYGNRVPLQDAQDEGKKVVKKWSTVGDDKVTPTHTQNEDDGWIPLDDTFSGTGDQEAPGSDNPRCRCTTLYEIRN